MRPGNISGWLLGEVTGDQVRHDRRLAKRLRALVKVDKKIASAEAKLAKLEAKQDTVVKRLAGWLGSWF